MRKKKVRRCPACDKLHMHLDRDMCSKCYNLLYVIPLAHEAQQKVREKLRAKKKYMKLHSLYETYAKIKHRSKQKNLSLYKPWRNFWKFKEYIYKNGYVDGCTYITRPNRKLGLSPYNIKLNIRNKENAEQ